MPRYPCTTVLQRPLALPCTCTVTLTAMLRARPRPAACRADNTGGAPQFVDCVFDLGQSPTARLGVAAQAIQTVVPKPYPLQSQLSDFVLEA